MNISSRPTTGASVLMKGQDGSRIGAGTSTQQSSSNLCASRGRHGVLGVLKDRGNVGYEHEPPKRDSM